MAVKLREGRKSMIYIKTPQHKPEQYKEIKELTELQERLNNKEITLIEFENRRMEIDREWYQ